MRRLRALLLGVGSLLLVIGITKSLQKTDAQQQAQYALEKSEELPWHEIVEYAKANLPLEGQLIIKSDGYVYLKLDDRYIHELFPLLGVEDEGYSEPPFFRSEESPGAHISVFDVDEQIIPEESDETFYFEPTKIVRIRPSKYASYVILQVYSPQLEQLREKYGLNPKKHGNEFHISIAKKTLHPRPAR